MQDEKKPCIAVDYDGVVADTSQLKADWIRENLGMSVSPGICDRTRCVERIGTRQYNRMAKVVYGREYSLRAQPVAGLKSAIPILAKSFRLVILSARDDSNILWVTEWLQKHGLYQHFSGVISTQQRQKLETASELGAAALFDDDIRHLRGPGLTSVRRFHFDRDLPEDVRTEKQLVHVKSWHVFLQLLGKGKEVFDG